MAFRIRIVARQSDSAVAAHIKGLLSPVANWERISLSTSTPFPDRNVLDERVGVVLLGKNWALTMWKPEDPLHIEVVDMFRRGIQVVPVLLDGAESNTNTFLRAPADLKELALLPPLVFHQATYTDDAIALADRIKDPKAEPQREDILALANPSVPSFLPSTHRTPTPRSSYDVFLCHNSDDKPAVRKLRDQLRKLELRPWLDEDELRPGQSQTDQLEKAARQIEAAAICVGPTGEGPWQTIEMKAILRLMVEEYGRPVIPVYLPTAPPLAKLPLFLEDQVRVNFRRDGDDNPLAKLYWGITGRKLPK